MMTACSGANRPRSGGLPARARTIPVVCLLILAACDLPTGLPRIESTFRFPIDDVVVPVTGVGATASVDAELDGIDIEDVRRGRVLVTPANAAGSTGILTVRFMGSGVTVTGTVDVAGGADQAIDVTGEEIRLLLGGPVTIEAAGTLCRSSGCGLSAPPFPNVTLENMLELVVQLGGESGS
jgi:hypothetical protein